MGLDEIKCDLWDKIIIAGDTSVLNCDNHEFVFECLLVEFYDTFGISKEYSLYLKKMNQYIIYLDKSINGTDKSMINFANVYKAEAMSIINKDFTTNIDKYAYVSKYMGFRVNPKEISVKEFYNYLKLAENGEENRN